MLPARTIEECLDYIYPSFDSPREVFSKKCVLVPLNECVRNINDTCIRRFPGNIKQYFYFNSVCEGINATHFRIEFLDSLEENFIVAKIITSAVKDETILISRIKHTIRERRHSSTTRTRRN